MPEATVQRRYKNSLPDDPIIQELYILYRECCTEQAIENCPNLLNILGDSSSALDRISTIVDEARLALFHSARGSVEHEYQKNLAAFGELCGLHNPEYYDHVRANLDVSEDEFFRRISKASSGTVKMRLIYAAVWLDDCNPRTLRRQFLEIFQAVRGAVVAQRPEVVQHPNAVSVNLRYTFKDFVAEFFRFIFLDSPMWMRLPFIAYVSLMIFFGVGPIQVEMLGLAKCGIAKDIVPSETFPFSLVFDRVKCR